MGNRARLSLRGRDILLIGTAHVSRESVEEVAAAIREEKPGMVCVELDAGRYSSIEKQDNWESLNVTKVLRERKGFLLIANIVLAGFQRRLGSETGVKPGEEMIAAVNAAKEIGAEFSLCDREVQVTLRRAWGKCGLWSKCKLLSALLASAFSGEKISADEIENLKKSSELDNMMSELASYLPAVKETLIDERDRYLAAKIWSAAGRARPRADGEAASEAAGNAAGTIAVIGAGHLQGVKAWIEKFAGDKGAGDPAGDLAELETIPPKTALAKCAVWAIPAIFVAFLVFGILRADPSRIRDMLVLWIALNSGLAALGGALALGHPLAVLAAAATAPFTMFLGPLASAGVFGGLAQATVRKPRVSDAQAILADITSLKGAYRNRITKVLLVFLLANLGSAFGSWIALGSIAFLSAR